MIKFNHFLLLTIVVGIISQLIHPAIETWIPVSIATYVSIAVLVVLAIYFWKKERQKAVNLGMLALAVFTEYALLSAIAYFRLIDDILSKGPEEIIILTIGCVLALILMFYEPIEHRVKR